MILTAGPVKAGLIMLIKMNRTLLFGHLLLNVMHEFDSVIKYMHSYTSLFQIVLKYTIL